MIREARQMSESDEKFPLDDRSMYANLFSFAGFPMSRDLSDAAVGAVVMGIPFDLATTGRSGARGGPNAIRQASANVGWEETRWPWEFPLCERLRAIDYGDVRFVWGDSEDMLAQVQVHAARITGAGKTLVCLGGDHFVTLPLLRGHAAVHGELALIHFDAHTDAYPGHGHVKYDHGSMFFHAPREGLIDPGRSVQVGIRTEYQRAGHQFLVIDAWQACEQAAAETAAAIRRRVGDRPAYLTFDIDCLDPAFAPGTGTPVVGGLSTARALQILHGIAELNIVGFDVVEVAPAWDSAQITALAGASLALQFLYMRAARG
jgi:agmatinase